LIKVTNQLVAAPVGSNVDIGCDVEASPRAMNSWYRDTGKNIPTKVELHTEYPVPFPFHHCITVCYVISSHPVAMLTDLATKRTQEFTRK
jgi:hypothetical protein